MMIIIWTLLIILVVLILWLVFIYNGLVRLKNRVNEAWSDIDVQLKRRYDLIPNLIETVKGYAVHEKGLFEKVTEARTKAISAQTVKDQGKAENMLSGALKSLFAVAENYPNLKANENFLELQRELTDTEDKIQAARRFYNGNVRDFNIKIEVFPNNLVAKTLGFIQRELFDIGTEEERKAPKVEF
jgi:LemA protein